jgi:hypothetical protein
VASLPGWLLSKVRRSRPTVYRAVLVDEFPESLRPLTVYIAGETGHQWGAALICPCGCGDRIELNLLPQVRPSWTVELQRDRIVTLMPSVWRRKGCKSHFFIRQGNVDWC